MVLYFSHFQATLSTTDLKNTGGAYLIKTFFNEVWCIDVCKHREVLKCQKDSSRSIVLQIPPISYRIYWFFTFPLFNQLYQQAKVLNLNGVKAIAFFIFSHFQPNLTFITRLTEKLLNNWRESAVNRAQDGSIYPN